MYDNYAGTERWAGTDLLDTMYEAPDLLEVEDVLLAAAHSIIDAPLASDLLAERDQYGEVDGAGW